MYTDWFHLRRLPFRLRPDPEFLYLTGSPLRVREGLRGTALRQTGLVLLLGGPGVGKTTLLHVLAQDIAGRREVARLQLAGLAPQEAFDSLAVQFGLGTPESGARTDFTRLSRYFAEASGGGRPAVILVDEAQLLPNDTLRELLALCTLKPSPLLVLAGEPILARQVQDTGHRSGASKPVAFSLPRLDDEQTRGYIGHRLATAGGTGALIDPEAFAEISRYTGGTPKLINALCDRAMALAELHSNPRVTAGEIRDAARDLKWVEFKATDVPAGDAPLVEPADTRPLQLEVRLNGVLVKQLTLTPGRLVIGRGDDTDLQLQSSFISRSHCQIVTTGAQSFIEDLGSTNGIIVNGKRLRVHRLLPEDRIKLGEHELLCLDAIAAAD